MNAHINMDLGIAAAEVSRGADIEALHDDFNKINTVLSDLVNDVQKDLTAVWPPLKWILKITGKIDDQLTDFSMELAREGAWKFANVLASAPKNEQAAIIVERDRKIARNSQFVVHPGFPIRLLFILIRLGEKGTIPAPIQHLED